MRKKIVVALCLVFVILAGITGCSRNDVLEGGSNDSSKAKLKVVIDWDQFSSIEPKQVSVASVTSTQDADMADVTHVGARIVYPGDNAAFSQSVKKETAEKDGIITFEVPESDGADLYVAAVHYEETGPEPHQRDGRAIWIGLVENVFLNSGSITEIKTEDITWIKPAWEQIDNFDKGTFADGFVFAVPEEGYDPSTYVKVRDPFQIGESPTHHTALVSVRGNSGIEDNQDGWRTFEVVHEHRTDEVDENGNQTLYFQPYVNYIPFNLPETDYHIEPVIEHYNVSWTGTPDPVTTYDLNVNILGEGSVTKNPDSLRYEAGTTVELTAEPSLGWSFYQWQGANIVNNNGLTTYLTVDEDMSVNAIFGEVILQDSFSNSSSGWNTSEDENTAREYVDGTYQMTVKKAGYINLTGLPTYDIPRYYSITTEVEVYSGNIGGYGLAFNGQDSDNYYTFDISTRGQCSVRKQENGEWSVVVDWMDVSGYLDPDVNRIRVTRMDNNYALYINGNYVIDVDVQLNSQPGPGLFAYTSSQTQELPFLVRFDNFEMLDLPY